MSNGLKYKEMASLEAFGEETFGVKIMVAMQGKRQMTEAAHDYIRNLCEKIMKKVERESDKVDQKMIADIAEEKTLLMDCFPEPIHAKAIPNGYDGDSLFPWYVVTTKRGPIKIGWRSKVINIEWVDSEIMSLAEALFPAENVTKGHTSIHAWDYDKAKEYIRVLMDAK